MDQSLTIPLIALAVVVMGFAVNIYIVQQMGGWTLLKRGIREVLKRK